MLRQRPNLAPVGVFPKQCSCSTQFVQCFVVTQFRETLNVLDDTTVSIRMDDGILLLERRGWLRHNFMESLHRTRSQVIHIK